MSLVVPTRYAATGERRSSEPAREDEPFAARSLPDDKDILVTVVVPCYNGAAFLAEALASAVAQTHSAVEIIVIDDGSTDESAEIAQRFPVRYIRQTNRGLSEARNLGIRASNGNYVVFLDADDRLLPDAVAAGLCALQARPDCAISVGDHAFIAADGFHLRKSSKTGAIHSPYEALLRNNFIEMISSVLFRRSVFDQVGTFNPTLRVAEDYDLYLRIARVQRICCHSTIMAEYRLHGANTSHNAELMLTATLKVLKSQKQYIGDDAGKGRAYLTGIRSWRKQYGRGLVSELARSSSFAHIDNLGRKLRTLAALYPQGLLMLPLLRLRSKSFPGDVEVRGEFGKHPASSSGRPRPSST